MPDVSAPAAGASAGAAPLKTSKFKVPGEGSSVGISVGTVLTLIALWFVSTNAGWVKPLFLPSPQAVFQQFVEYLTGTANDKPLLVLERKPVRFMSSSKSIVARRPRMA